jgi:hypothetical protein
MKMKTYQLEALDVVLSLLLLPSSTMTLVSSTHCRLDDVIDVCGVLRVHTVSSRWAHE